MSRVEQSLGGTSAAYRALRRGCVQVGNSENILIIIVIITIITLITVTHSSTDNNNDNNPHWVAPHGLPWPAYLRSTAASSTDAVLEIVYSIIMWVLTTVHEIRKTKTLGRASIGSRPHSACQPLSVSPSAFGGNCLTRIEDSHTLILVSGPIVGRQ